MRLHQQAPATAELPLGATAHASHATSCIHQSCKGSAPQSLASLRDPRLSGTKLCGAYPSGQSETIPQKPTCACGYRQVPGDNAPLAQDQGSADAGDTFRTQTGKDDNCYGAEEKVREGICTFSHAAKLY